MTTRLPRLLPGPRLLPLIGAWALLAVPLPWLPEFQELWLGAGSLFLLAVLLEALLLCLKKMPVATRDIAAVVPLGVWKEVGLHFEHPGKQPLNVQVFDHTPAAGESENLPLHATLPAHSSTRLAYRLRFNRRGVQQFPGLDLRLPGRLGLLTRQVFLPVLTEIHVYPNFAEVAKYALLASDNRLSQLGVRLRRRRGSGLEFHQLREYREGDTLKQIDWKATSRLRKLVAREYQDERDQQIMLLLDGGFRMRSQDGRLSHFDEALNALLLLAYVVQRQGDAAGLMTFANDERFLPPAKGREVLARMMKTVFDLEPGAQTPDFLHVCTQLGERLRKRSLVIIMTSLRDEDSSELLEACKLLGERHLVLIANLREHVLDDMDTCEPGDPEQALTVAATHLYLQEREKALNRLRHQGVIVLDTRPDTLAVGLINRYLEIKRSKRL